MIEGTRSSEIAQQTSARDAYVLRSIHHELEATLGEDNVTREPSSLQQQASDHSWRARFLKYSERPLPTADFAVWPSSTEEVCEVVKIASRYRMPTIPRGAGSGVFEGTLAPYGGVSVDLTRMNRLIDVDTESLIVTAEAGIDGLTLEEALKPKGLTLSHDPGSLYWGATLGGWLAARGAGVTSTKYGKAEDLVMQVEAVVPPGKKVSTLPVPSHAVGPGLLQLMVGSEGTLGVLTSASMRLDPIPEARHFLAFSFDTVSAGLRAGRAVMTSRWRPAAMRLYDEAGAAHLKERVDIEQEGVLMVIMCDGDRRLADLEATAIRELCLENGGTDVGEAPAKAWWDGRYEPHAKGKTPEPPRVFGTTDSCCTFDKIDDLYHAKKAVVEDGFREYGARYTAHFSHWYPWGTMVYDRFYVDDPPDDPDEAMKLYDRIWDAATDTALRHGAVINDHHGIGATLGRFMQRQYGENTFAMLRGIKDSLDPDGIMNPGKLGFGPPR